MIISHRHRFVFIHIHKTAGESVTAALEPVLGPHDIVLKSDFDVWLRTLTQRRYRGLQGLHKHSTARAARARLPREVWDGYYTFTFVRDPIARAVSLYRYIGTLADRRAQPRLRHAWYHLSDEGRKADPARWQVMAAFVETDSFSDFIRHPGTSRTPGMWPQTRFVTGRKGQILLDEIGRFESLDADFARIADHLGLEVGPLPRVNISTHGTGPGSGVGANAGKRVEVTDEDRAYLLERYADDVRLFGYDG